jgi:hypothetical protein
MILQGSELLKFMKSFITLKVGYSVSIYGCSAEYFTTIIIKGKKIESVSHYGLYGSEDRINHILKDAGYIERYIPSDFGKIPSRGLWKGFKSEEVAITEIKEMIK